jgi:hypothetical protein
MKINLSKIAAGLVLAYVSSFANASAIVNGGFESGMSGWTCVNADLCTTTSGGNPGQSMYGYANVGYASLFQNVTTVAGGIYQLTFDAMAGNSRNEIGYSFSGFSNVVWTHTGFSWAAQSGSFTATGASTKVEFFLATDPGTGIYRLDNVNLVQTGTTVPEPGSLALLGLGLAGFAAARRKRQA